MFSYYRKCSLPISNEWAMRKAFASGLKLLPSNTHIPHAWAIEELKIGNVDSARKLFEYALERDPHDGLIYQVCSSARLHRPLFPYAYVSYVSSAI